MNRMMQEMVEMLKAMVEDETLLPTVAKGYKKMYDSLVAEGFSQEQAMQIVSSQGMGVKTS